MAASAPQEKHSAAVVGQAFAEQYYTVLHQSPAFVYRFYQDSSKLSRPEDGTNMSLTTGMEEINAKIQSYGTLKAEITSIDAQESYDGGVLVLITGYMAKEGDIRQSFTQTFFLAPQKVGFFVLNDIFRYLEDGHSQPENYSLANAVVEAENSADQETSLVQQNEIVDQPEEINGGEVYDPSEDGEGSEVKQEELEPVVEIVNEVQGLPAEPEAVVEIETKTEEAPKKTYASIVMRESGKQIPAPASLKSTPKVQQYQQVSATPPPPPVKENTIPNSNVVDDVNNQEGEGEAFSIYVKNLPLNATPTMLEESFKNFGSIKSGGIQVRSNKGFCFGFVEFEGPDAVQNAIEAGSVVIGGRQVVIEGKRSTTSRGSTRGRFPPGRGGFRTEGPRGRGGSYGRGRGYGRGDFVRNDYGSRGNGRGYQNRNFDGYEKGEMGNGGARVSRGGGPVSASDK